MKFPEVPKGLVDLLTEQFPDRCPRSDLGAFGFGMQAGQQKVLDLIKHHYDRQQESNHVRPKG